MHVAFNVKEKSVYAFLEERLLEHRPDERERVYDFTNVSPYHLLKDEMYFKKNCGIKPGQLIKIELYDSSKGSGKTLKNIYTYRAEKYDDVSIKLTLHHFTIEHVQA